MEDSHLSSLHTEVVVETALVAKVADSYLANKFNKAVLVSHD